MDGGKVVYLKFRSDRLEDDTMAFLACSACRNKTFTHTIDQVDNFPLVRCAACGQHIGRVGYADTQNPEAVS